MEEEKLPLKRVEISLSKFNDVAIPHHLDLLRQHRTNIIKLQQSGDTSRVPAEQARARRVVTQLRSLLRDASALRERVRDTDHARFDRLTQRSRDLTLAAILDYLGVIEESCMEIADGDARMRRETTPVSMERRSSGAGAGAGVGSAVSTDSVGVVAHAPLHLQLQADTQALELEQREAELRGWTALQRDVRELHAAWLQLHAAATDQANQVSGSEQQVEAAAVNVSAARQHLAAAHRYRVGWAGAAGAALGAALGGPLGLIAGAKAGAAAAVAGGLLGYSLAGPAARRALPALPAPDVSDQTPDQACDKSDTEDKKEK